jgi:aminoglycoside phosphotransferase family enzyme/predicted kinase
MGQDAVISFLSDPRNFGPKVASVERHETHGAIVFLAGDKAYKLKREVKYPYMDYSTLALRRANCEAELKVNRRTAPELYREVRPILRDDRGTLRFGTVGESDEVIDWVVVMKRFEQSALLEEMRKRGELTASLTRQLADTVAQFHRAAEIRRDFGGAPGILKVIDENVLMFTRLKGQPFKPRAIDHYRSRSLEVLRQISPLLEQRRRDGFVRLCHGDLHLNNICLIDERPVLFDAIEFNEQFSCIDVLYDLAFLVMDLEHHGLRPLANALLNRYLEDGQDYGGLPALPLFLSCRAGLRAHVAATLATSASGDVSVHLCDAARLLDDAIALLACSKPTLVAIGGLSGSGKSTIARAVAPEIGRAPGAVILRSDVIRKRLCGVDEMAPLPQRAYTPAVSSRVYNSMVELAKKALASGHSVVADAVYGTTWERARIESVARNCSARFCGQWLEAPLSVLESRIGQRTQDASDATLEVLHKQCRAIEAPRNWVRVDASGSVALSVTRVLSTCVRAPIAMVTA